MSTSEEVQTWHTHASVRVLAAMVMAGQAVAAVWGFIVLARAGELLLAFVAPLAFIVPGWAWWYWVSAFFGRPTKAEKVAAFLELRASYYRAGINLGDDSPGTSADGGYMIQP